MNKIDRIKELIKLLNKYSYEYYVLDKPTIDDKEYDLKYDELVKLEKETGYIEKNSPTQRIGDVTLSKFKKVQHRSHLWSLDKSQTKEGVLKFCKDVKKFVREYNLNHIDQLPAPKFVVTEKYDGLTINCTYDKKELIQGATRGTGVVGEEITPQVKTIINLPKKINEENSTDVHGEGLMTKKGFNEYNSHLNSNEEPLKNLRNGAAGALRNLNSKETAKRKLITIMYDLSYTNKNFKTYVETLEYIKKLGFSIPEYKVCNTFDEVDKVIDHIGSIRDSLQYAIDGVVIAVDDLKTRVLMGNTIKFPKWSIAYKFEAEQAITKLIGVEWNTGRTGKCVPTGIIEPVQIGDVVVKRVTLNNIDDINKKGLKLNADILIRRSNDVIPEVLTVIHDSLNREDIQDINVPNICPSCGSKLIRDGVHYFCQNTLGCKAQLVKNINHFAERKAMNIIGISEKTIQQLMDANILNTIVDLYKLKDKKEDILKLERFAKTKFNNLINAIEESKICKLNSFVYALGIPNIGEKTSKDLVKQYNSLNSLINASFDDLMKINDIGKIVAASVWEYFHDKKNIKMINELLQYINIMEDEKKVNNSLKDLMGLTFVITGDLNTFKNRDELKILIEDLQGKTSGSVSKKTSYLINNNLESMSGKNKKAHELNIPIINEDQFNKMIGRIV